MVYFRGMDPNEQEPTRTTMTPPCYNRHEGFGRVFYTSPNPDASGWTRMYQEDGRYMGCYSEAGDVVGGGSVAGTASTPLLANVLLHAHGWTAKRADESAHNLSIAEG